MRIAIIDPFLDVSHKYWADGIVTHSQHEIELYHNKPKHWKWQMIGGTIEMAEKIKSKLHLYDLIVVTDMLDLPCFLGYLTGLKIPPIVLYFHENQITYPWSSTDEDLKEKRDHHYGFINLRSAMVADHIVFNSSYHSNSFFGALPKFMNQFPSIKWPFTINLLKKKSSVIPIGLAAKVEVQKSVTDLPVFIWNHRWEYDKGPEAFFNTLFEVKNKGYDFSLIVLGKPYIHQPPIFEKAKKELASNIMHWGYAESKNEYYHLLSKGNIAIVTSNQDFFGISVIEAIQYGNLPLLPRRLAYPEHLPKGINDVALYDEGELMNKLIQIIDSKSYQSSIHYETHIKKYMWKDIIKSYDHLFKVITKKQRDD